MFIAGYPATFLQEKTGGFHVRFPDLHEALTGDADFLSRDVETFVQFSAVRLHERFLVDLIRELRDVFMRKATFKMCLECGFEPGNADDGVFGALVTNKPPYFLLKGG